MRKWEYLVLSDPGCDEDQLTILGVQGWELVTASVPKYDGLSGDTRITGVMKRPGGIVDDI